MDDFDKRSGAPHTRRWSAQRWLVDNVIRYDGIDWDQLRERWFVQSSGAVVAHAPERCGDKDCAGAAV